MRLRYRLVFLFLFLIALFFIGRIITGDFSFVVDDFWFAAGLLLLVLISLIDQPFFSTDANVFMNGTAGLSLVLVAPLARDFWWKLFLVLCIWLVISSFILMWINAYRPERQNPIRNFLSKTNRELGKPETMFSAFFLWGAIKQFGLDSKEIEPLFAFWVIFVLLNLPSMAREIDKFLESLFSKDVSNIDIGKLYRVSDPRVVEIKLNVDAPTEIVGKIVDLKTHNGNSIAEAIVIDDRIVVGSRIAKVVATAVTSHWGYLAQEPEKMIVEVKNVTATQDVAEMPISVVDIGSNISAIKFYIHPDIFLKKGEIVWASALEDEKVHYQVILADIVEKKTVDGNINQSVLVTANQLGIWDEETLRFEQFSWVPPSGSLVFRLAAMNAVGYELPGECTLVGNVPFSNFPVHAKISDLVTHNTAVVGVTGSGKSYLAFHLIESFLAQQIKVLILDLTREHYMYLQRYNPTQLRTASDVASWYASESLLGIHQFANSTSYPLTTKEFVEAAFEQLSTIRLQPGAAQPARLCLVFEEAHSLIPEWNQVADRNDPSRVNATARTILQGRKFGMGSLVITQRTANVTKTILNQCNTIFAMRSFDQTGLDFLSNYMGNEYSQAISTLPSRNAILVGKSSSCQTPVIFSVPDYSDRWSNSDES